MVIDGYTQPGASPNTLSQGDNAVLRAQLDLSALHGGPGSPADNNQVGLSVPATDTTIRGLVLNDLTYAAGEAIGLGANDQVQGCFLGTDVSGATVVGGGMGTTGIAFARFGVSTVGGTTPDARNIIAGFGAGFGDYPVGPLGGTGHVVEGNYIGTDASGTKALGNGTGVALVYYGATIAGNLISGNQTGISVNHVSAQIQGDLIGTDVTGTTAAPNGTGIVLQGPAPALVAGNTIAHNNGNGVSVYS
jgi:hypothetical protein